MLSKDDFLMSLDLELPNTKTINIASSSVSDRGYITNLPDFNGLFDGNNSQYKDNFIINYWSSKLSNESFDITHIQTPDINSTFVNALSGIHKNDEVTQLIIFFDYLKDSSDPSENATGKHISHLIKKIIEIAVSNSELKHISRGKLQPVFSVSNREVTLDKLSSGNIYLIQRLIYLLKQTYANSVNFNIPIEEIQNTPGILLIDEAENHLHPKWQKSFLGSILKIFPHIQLIVTTHSPFIVSSVENSIIYVCRNSSEGAIVKEETDYYSNKPFEDILLSPLFNTSNFNSEISILLEKRKNAKEQNDTEKVSGFEKELLAINPDYFHFLNIEKLLKEIKNEAPK